MPYYIQYRPVEDKTYGEIIAEIFNTMENPPQCENQIAFATKPDTDGKVVDLATKELIAAFE